MEPNIPTQNLPYIFPPSIELFLCLFVYVSCFYSHVLYFIRESTLVHPTVIYVVIMCMMSSHRQEAVNTTDIPC